MIRSYFWLSFGAGFLMAGLLAFLWLWSTSRTEVDVYSFRYQDADNRAYELPRKSDKIRLVSFWATSCKPCVEEFKDFQRLRQRYPDRLEILAVSDEAPDRLARFRARNPYDFTFLRVEGKLTDRGINAIPVNVLLNREGKAVASQVGSFSGKELEELLAGHL